METLELTKEARRANILAAYQQTMDELQQRQDERMQRYFDCQDDYSWEPSVILGAFIFLTFFVKIFTKCLHM